MVMAGLLATHILMRVQNTGESAKTKPTFITPLLLCFTAKKDRTWHGSSTYTKKGREKISNNRIYNKLAVTFYLGI
jgi:hypothetical protein